MLDDTLHYIGEKFSKCEGKKRKRSDREEMLHSNYVIKENFGTLRGKGTSR